MTSTTSGAAGKPRQYVRPIPWGWWLKKPAYTKFMVREVTSAFIAAYACALLVLMCGARDVPAFHHLYQALRTPLSVAAHGVVLGFSLFHTVTFFNLTPRALVVRVGEEKLSEDFIRIAHYAAWVLVTIVLFLLAIYVD